MRNNKLKILGCVSPYSNFKDNCPGYLLSINNNKILLDCGPGVCKKLNIPSDLDNLNVFISHFHKDHYTDIYAIAYASYVYHKLGLLENKVKVYIPKISKSEYEYEDYCLLKHLKEQYFEIIEYDEKSQIKISGISITFIKNYHSIITYSTKIEYDNKKIVYASDLGFKSKDAIINFSKNASVLLIESTYLETDNGSSDFHLTTSQAAIIAKEANVNKLVLTHFWPNQSKIKYFKEAKKFFDKTVISKDNLMIKI